MFKSYLKIIARNLWKNKLYTLINVMGIGIGIAAVVWGFQNYRYSFSYDNFHKNRESIFRVLTKTDGNDKLKGVVPMPLAANAKNDFSEVTDAVRWGSRNLDIKAEQNEPFATRAHFTDPSFLKLFNFPVVQGNSHLEDPSAVLLTETAAKKFFGTVNPLGKTLLFYSDESYKKPLLVTGILKDPPLNSSFRFEILTNFTNQYKGDGSIIKNDDWGWFSDAVFLKLSHPSAAAKLASGLNKYLAIEQTARKDLKVTAFKLDPLTEVASHSREIDLYTNELMPRPEDSAAYAPLILSILILLSACLNFANTSVSQSNRRLKEIGIRKVIGGSARQIMIQQLLECACIVLMAIGLSVLINNLWLPTYNAMFSFIKVSANYLTDYTLIVFLAAILLFGTLLAGAYPAFYISRFNATNIFRGSVKFGGSNLFSRILLGFQVTISFITVILGFAFSRNAEFQRAYNFGYDKENIVGVQLQNEATYASFRDELSKNIKIEKIAGTRDQVGFSYRTIPLEAKGEKKDCYYLETGTDYLDAMNLPLVAGRKFNTAGEGDYNRSMLINEKMAFQFGWKAEEAIGKEIRKGDTATFTIVGVLKDFTQNTLFTPIEPLAMCAISPDRYSQVIIRAKQGELTTVYNEAKMSWEKLFPLKPFRGYYQNEIAADTSKVNKSIATIFFWFALISVFMTATGMFALVSLSVLKKMREIAIRKVVGANGWHIFKLLIKGYSLIFIIASVIGCYAGYTLAKLLLDLIFRINSGVSMTSLTLSFLCVLLISSVTIGTKVWNALHKKTTDVLKAN